MHSNSLLGDAATGLLKVAAVTESFLRVCILDMKPDGVYGRPEQQMKLSTEGL